VFFHTFMKTEHKNKLFPSFDRQMVAVLALSFLILCIAMMFFSVAAYAACDGRACAYEREGWKTDFSNITIDLDEVLSGGPPKDGIPSIDNPIFVPVAESTTYADVEPVIGLIINGEARAYPLSVLTWHEIVNDTVGGTPVAVTYCPLCNAAIVFDRRHDGQVLDFGTTGKLRRSDLVMYDRQTETWWQQFEGAGIAGTYAGQVLKTVPARLESWANFKERAPQGVVLIPNNPNMREYGRNPYVNYDTVLSRPFLYRGPYDLPVPMMMRVVVVGDQAWTLPYLQKRGSVNDGDIVLNWTAGQASALNSGTIAKGRDVGNVTAQTLLNGAMTDITYDVTFAFVFNAFRPEGMLFSDPEDAQ